ncbi:hypothetical protein [Anaeromyxobacter soli]|uniref:hypothetical protein n=1 Tax=Anaeromyxobacter soli TaxID=2922725 RepID=UPI001FAEFC7C|nr:hypothetical protein [Anaeromyxobacter sp. SG29]
MDQPTHMRVSARIPASLFFRLEDERHRLHSLSKRRVSVRELIQRAIENLLEENTK